MTRHSAKRQIRLEDDSRLSGVRHDGRIQPPLRGRQPSDAQTHRRHAVAAARSRRARRLARLNAATVSSRVIRSVNQFADAGRGSAHSGDWAIKFQGWIHVEARSQSRQGAICHVAAGTSHCRPRPGRLAEGRRRRAHVLVQLSGLPVAVRMGRRPQCKAAADQALTASRRLVRSSGTGRPAAS